MKKLLFNLPEFESRILGGVKNQTIRRSWKGDVGQNVQLAIETEEGEKDFLQVVILQKISVFILPKENRVFLAWLKFGTIQLQTRELVGSELGEFIIRDGFFCITSFCNYFAGKEDAYLEVDGINYDAYQGTVYSWGGEPYKLTDL